MIIAAIGIGLIVTINVSKFYGLLYLGLSTAGSLAIISSFCTKCPCKDTNCGHVLPGLLTKILPDRTPEKYTISELGLVITAFISILAFPQYFLWPDKPAFIIFWMLIILGLIDIRLFVCRACDNKNCPAKI